MRRLVRDAMGYTLEFVDKHVLRHRYQGVCLLCWRLFND